MVSRDGAFTILLDNLVQYFITLIIKMFFLISSLNLHSSNLKPLPLDILQQAAVKKPVPIFLVSTLLSTEGHRRYYQSLFFIRLNKPSSLSLSSKEQCFSPLIIYVALQQTCSNRSTRFLFWSPRAGFRTLGVVSSEQRGRKARGGQNHPLLPAGHVSFDALCHWWRY